MSPRDCPDLSILILTEFFPSRIQPWLLNTIEEAVRRGARVTLVAAGRQGRSYPERVDELDLLGRTRYISTRSARDFCLGVTPYLHPLSTEGRQAFQGLWSLSTNDSWRPSGIKDWAKALVRAPLLGDGGFDLVHAHHLVEAYEYMFIPRILGIPLITTFHGLNPKGARRNLPFEKSSLVFRHGTLFLVNTRFAQNQLENLGCPAEKIHILPQGLHLETFPYRPKAYPKEGPVVILTVGRLAPDKGHRYAIEAVARLVRGRRDVEYRIVGHGPDRLDLESLVRALCLERHVSFLGELTDAELQKQYGEAHIFVLPSVRDHDAFHEETQGVVIQEAQASGMIVVATRTGGIPECVDDGRSAFLVPDRDPHALAEQIAWVMDCTEMWEFCQRDGRAWVETRFAMERIGQKLWDIYCDNVNRSTFNA